MCFIAVTQRGISDFHFIDENRSRNEYQLFCQKWGLATITHRPEITHRIICKTGEVGNYSYGRVRKHAMIAWDMARIRV
jgi:AraC family transcriptional regulator of adaptative response/methylated-DNA-[protein]-cysteine methyltransferase